MAWVLARRTGLGILAVYASSVSTALIKRVIGAALVHKRCRVNTLSGAKPDAARDL